MPDQADARPFGPSNPRRARLLAALALLFSLAVSVLVVEVILRVWKRDIAFRPDPELMRSLRPNRKEATYSYETQDNLNGRSDEIPDGPQFTRYIYTNNIGLRMREDIGPKQPDERRVLLLGDSFTEAFDSDQSKRFSGLVDTRLRERETGRLRSRLINGGIANGSPAQYVLQVRKYLPMLEPDIVVVVTGANDHWDDVMFERRYGLDFDEQGLPLRPQARLQLSILRYWYGARYLHSVLRIYLPSLLEIIFPLANPSLDTGVRSFAASCTDTPEITETFEQRTGKYLNGLKLLSNEAGVSFGVIAIFYRYLFEEPYYEDRYPTLREDVEASGCFENRGMPYQNRIVSFLTENEIPHRSTYEAFWAARRANPARKLYNFHDYHFSPAGHEIVAAELYDLVDELIRSEGG